MEKYFFRTLHIEWLSPQPRDRLSHYNLIYSHEDNFETVSVEVKNSSGNSHKVRLASNNDQPNPQIYPVQFSQI